MLSYQIHSAKHVYKRTWHPLEGVLKTTVTQTKTHTKLNKNRHAHTFYLDYNGKRCPHGAVISGWWEFGGLWSESLAHKHPAYHQSGPWQHPPRWRYDSTRLLQASEGKFGAVALTPSSVHFLSARNLFYKFFCRVKICEMDRTNKECIRTQDSVFCHKLHASHPVIQINFLLRFMPLCRCEIIPEKMPLDRRLPQAER